MGRVPQYTVFFYDCRLHIAVVTGDVRNRLYVVQEPVAIDVSIICLDVYTCLALLV